MEVAEDEARAAVPEEEEQASALCGRRYPGTVCTTSLCRDQGPHTHLEAPEALHLEPEPGNKEAVLCQD